MPRLRQRTGTWCKQKAAAGVGQQAEAEEVAEEAGEAEAAVATEVAGEDENVLGEHLVLHRGSMIPKLKVTQLSSITSNEFIYLFPGNIDATFTGKILSSLTSTRVLYNAQLLDKCFPFVYVVPFQSPV